MLKLPHSSPDTGARDLLAVRTSCPSESCGVRGAAIGPLGSQPEVSERLVGSPAFKAGGTGDPRPAGSIPVHLR